MNETKVTKGPKGRPSRKPVGHRDRLVVHDQDPNYIYRWVLESDETTDRVGWFESMGYEIVPKGTHRIGNQRVSEPSGQGTAETLSAGGGAKLILMRILKEWYDEAQEAKAAEQRERMKAVHQVSNGFYGRITSGIER